MKKNKLRKGGVYLLKENYKKALRSYCDKVTVEMFPDPILFERKITISDIFQPFSDAHIDLSEESKSMLLKKRAEGYKHKVMISGHAGDGKSTFMKCLTISYLDGNTDFFEKHNDALYTIIPKSEMPVFAELSHLRSIDEDELKKMPLAKICFKIAKNSYLRDVDIDENEYEKLFNKSSLLVFDAYDEIISKEKEKIFREKLKTTYEQKEVILSCREEKVYDFVDEKFFVYPMPLYNAEDIRGFIGKYYKLCGCSKDRAENVIKELEITELSFLKDISKSPLMLTLLLTSLESGGGGYYLPTNLNELLEKITNRMFRIYQNKSREHTLSTSTLKIFLRYIAMGLVEWDGIGLLTEEVSEKIEKAKKEKDGYFKENIFNVDSRLIYNELLATGFIIESDGLVSFSNHRLFLEYFAGLGLADIAYENVKNFFIDTISDEDCSRWKMPYIFFLLNKKNKVNDFLSSLIANINTDSVNDIKIFLIDLIIYKAVCEAEYRIWIYRAVFKESDFFTKNLIHTILEQKNYISDEFKDFIEVQANDSYRENKSDFFDSLAIIKFYDEKNPLEYMENRFGGNDESIFIAAHMLNQVLKTDEDYEIVPKDVFDCYRMSDDCAEAIFRIYKCNANKFILDYLTEVLVRACAENILAFSQIFPDENFDYLVSELNEGGKNVRYFEMLLGIADINKLSYNTSVSEEVKKRFLNEYWQRISDWDINAVYSFVKCVKSGCFTHENYSYVDFRELKSVVAANIYGRLSPDDFSTNKCPQEMLLHRIQIDLLFEKVYTCNENVYKVIFKDAEFSLTDVERLLFVENNENAICNNLSNLLRRGLVQEVTKNGQVVTETYLNANNGDFLSTINESLLKVGLNKEFYDWLHNTNLSEESDLMVGASNYYEKLAAEYSQRIKVFFEKIQEAYEFLLSKKFTLTKEDAFACIYSWSEPKNGERDFEGFVLLTLLWKFDEFIFDEYCVEDKDNFIHIGSLARDFLKSGLASQDVFWGVFSALYTTHLKRYCIDKLLEKDLDDTAEFKLIEGKIYAVIDKYIFYKDYDCMLCGNNEGEYHFLYYDEAQKKEIVIEDKESMKSVLYDFYENILE